MKVKPLTIKRTEAGCVNITREQLKAFGITDEQIASGEIRGKLETFGMWQLPVSYRALCVHTKFNEANFTTTSDVDTIFGFRTMREIRQCGHEIEGRVSINGKKYSCFSSSTIYKLEDGTLVNIAEIFPRLPEDFEFEKAPKALPVDPDDIKHIAENPEGAESDELKKLSDFLSGYTDLNQVQAAQALYGKRRGNVRAARTLRTFTSYIRRAREDRLKGEIESAKQWEMFAERAYNSLPKFAKW